MTLETTIVNETTNAGSANRGEQRGTLVLQLRGGQLLVDIEYVGQGVVASDKESGIFGEGADVPSAVDDLLDHLTISLRDLSGHEERLTADLASALARLRSLFGE
jgi:hypothetical protein